MMIPDAPAKPALVTFWANGQVPRWISAILPGTNPAKSSVSQPLVELGTGVGGRVRSTPCTWAVTSPGGDGGNVKKSSFVM